MNYKSTKIMNARLINSKDRSNQLGKW